LISPVISLSSRRAARRDLEDESTEVVGLAEVIFERLHHDGSGS
jgi:hypothetical protein